MGLLRAGHLAAVAGVVVVALWACASPGSVGDGGGPAVPDHDYQAVGQWAAEVADAWSPTGSAWRQGYVPLQEPTAIDGEMNEAQKRALSVGWWASAITLPADRPAPGKVLFRDGSLSAPLMSAAETYQKMDLGDPPLCGATALPPTTDPTAGPDGSVSAPGGGDCVGLTVSQVSLTTMEVRTSRGVATVPAWRFGFGGGRAVLHAAVANPAPTPAPAPTPTNRGAPPELVAVQGVTGADGLDLHYELGVGACDSDITPIVVERPNVVVVSGGVKRPAGECTDQLLISPVTVTLNEPLGDRPVVDARNGTLLPVGRS